MAGNQVVVEKPKSAKKTLKRLCSVLRESLFIIIIVLLLSFISNILSLIGPSLAGSAINEASKGKGMVNFVKVTNYVMQMLILYGVSSLLTIGINLMMTYVAKRTSRRLRELCFDKLSRLPVSFFDTNQAGDIMSRVSYDTDVVSTCLQTDIVQIMTSVVMAVGSFIMMIKTSPLLSVIVVVTIPVALSYTVYIKNKTRPLYVKRSKSYGAMNGFTEEMFSGLKTISSFATEEEVEKDFDSYNKNAASSHANAEYYGMTIGQTMGLVNNISLALIAMLGSFFFMGGRVTLGQISSFVLYSRRFAGPINEAANVLNEIISSLSAAERIFSFLDSEEEIPETKGAIELKEVMGNVEFNHVNFGYTKDRTIIHDLSFKADKGKMIAIVGPTGAGKTTIINLLMRFYDYNKGTITLDGIEEKEFIRSSLRSQYALVLQDTWLFNGTVKENIAYGKENATMEEIVRAAKKAKIHSFIMKLPKGYDTVLSEDGANISKGQKQLLTIARAMLYDSKMLILDEATSNVDTNTEHAIQEAMRALMHDKTTFVIAHRLSTIKNADLILVLNDGDVVEQGTHSSLMAKKGYYYNLYISQFE